MWPHQLAAAQATKPFRVIVKARQTGGSTLLAVVAIHTAFTRPGSTSLLLSATEDAAKRLAGEVRSLLTGSRLLAEWVTEEQKARLVLSNGSRIISLPSSEKQVRGYTVDGVLILDEAAFMDESLWRAALYTVAAVRNPLVYLCSTPWGSRDHFFRRLWEEGQDPANPDYVSFQWDYTVSPKINKALLERERERIDPLTYRSEVLGEWPDAADSYFSYDEIMSAVADYPLLPPEEASGHNAVAGVDYGVRNDSIQQGRLVLPRHPGLMQQLTGLRYEMLQSGAIRIEAASPAIHDDLADALAHAAAATAPFDRDRRWLVSPPYPLDNRQEYAVTPGGTRVPLPLEDHLDRFGRWAA